MSTNDIDDKQFEEFISIFKDLRSRIQNLEKKMDVLTEELEKYKGKSNKNTFRPPPRLGDPLAPAARKLNQERMREELSRVLSKEEKEL